MLFLVIINVSKFSGPVAKDMFPTFLKAQEASVGRYGTVIKRRVQRVDNKQQEVGCGLFQHVLLQRGDDHIEYQQELSGKTDSW